MMPEMVETELAERVIQKAVVRQDYFHDEYFIICYGGHYSLRETHEEEKDGKPAFAISTVHRSSLLYSAAI